ncbi:DDE-type integrase/transposase/recombinase [Maricaulis sp.]|uniref:DDE-type integrase/transposase/recombinase n=1 Tax=Maricaulis sp. TaxID=1486257 RepID=UPI0032999AE4
MKSSRNEYEKHPGWKFAQKAFAALRPCLSSGKLAEDVRAELMEELGISEATLYRYLDRLRARPVASSLLPKRASTGSGRNIDGGVSAEALMQTVIEKYYLAAQKRTVAAAYKQLLRVCVEENVDVPSYSTFHRRVRALSKAAASERRLGARAHRSKYSPKTTHFETSAPMEIVQIDSTIMDVMLVDRNHREEIGRPVLTVAVDVYTRMIVGFHIDFIGPSTESIAATLRQLAFPKDDFLRRYGITGDWPTLGLPKALHMDNGKEFRSTAMSRGAGEHGIELLYRPVGTPHFGGHVESVIRTLMLKTHELPGTTFSNITDKGRYDSSAKASLTMPELLTFIGRYIVCQYHHTVHSRTGMTPIARYQVALENGFAPLIPAKEAALFEADFRTRVVRMTGRGGIQFERIEYWSPDVQAWYDNNVRKISVLPVSYDVSVIDVIGPDGALYTVPAKSDRVPNISRAEWRAYRDTIDKRQPLNALTDRELAKLIEQEHQHVQRAKELTRKAKRSRDRQAYYSEVATSSPAIHSSKASLDSEVTFDASDMLPIRLRREGMIDDD